LLEFSTQENFPSSFRPGPTTGGLFAWAARSGVSFAQKRRAIGL
jgi:hypothetical protein